MGQIVVNVGSFDLTSHNGNTAYSTTRYFTVPANSGITSCVATFATHVNTGSFQGKSFSLNSVQAHPNTPWPTSGISLNPALLSAGQNAFRAAVKSQAGLSARWSIGDIYLTIDYIDPSGGGGGNIGAVTINKTSLTAGDTITVSASACDAIYSRSIVLMLADNTVIGAIEYNFGTAAKSWTVTVPESLCAAYAADSETLIIKAYMEVYQISTYVGSDAKNFTMYVPASAVPTIGTFTATLNKNGVDASITGYVQNYSKVDLEVIGASGALGSTISAYEIIGGGWSGDEALETFGPFSQSGDITFTAKVTDTRGRTVTGSVTINVLPYTPVSAVSISAFRSDSSGDPDDEGTYAALKGKRVYSLLGGENTATISGRVFEKGATPSSWSIMMDDTPLLIGSLSIEKGYTVQIAIADKITSVIYIIEIPTAIVGMHILPGATGASFGMYAKEGWFSVPWPVDSSEGACPGIDDILYTFNPTHPAIRFPGTTWSALPSGKFLRVGTGGETGGSDTHEHGLSAGYANVAAPIGVEHVHIRSKTVTTWYSNKAGPLQGASIAGSGALSEAAMLSGTTDSASNVPAYIEVYAWRRTA